VERRGGDPKEPVTIQRAEGKKRGYCASWWAKEEREGKKGVVYDVQGKNSWFVRGEAEGVLATLSAADRNSVARENGIGQR